MSDTSHPVQDQRAISADDAWEWYRGIIVQRMEAPYAERWRWRVAARDAKDAFVRAMTRE